MARLQAKFGETEARKIAAREARERPRARGETRGGRGSQPHTPRRAPRREGRRGGDGGARGRGGSASSGSRRREWWDAPLLADGTYDDVRDGAWNVAEDKMTLYVEHPVPMEPPVEDEAPPPQPLMLTKKEQKKLRTQRRRAREEEKQEMIRQGLMEAPKPKVKISNLMRVLTDEATADPTAVEREVREQMKNAADAHADRTWRGCSPRGAQGEEDAQTLRRSERRRGNAGTRVPRGIHVEPQKQVQGGHQRAGEPSHGCVSRELARRDPRPSPVSNVCFFSRSPPAADDDVA